MKTTVEIVGAGPAGLAAALTISRNGGRAIVFERDPDVGHRFHGDFQGIENWSSKCDVLEELSSLGIAPTFDYTPFRECVFYDSRGREQVCRAAQPLFYLVRRGPGPGTLDQGLKEQAVAAGVEFRFATPRSHLPQGGIVAHGPQRADAIASGYVFDTDRADGAYAVVSDRLAPKGYSYLLICNGKGTIASCLFADFHNERTYVQRTVEFFRVKTGIEMKNSQRFGGFGNLFSSYKARKGKILYAGEAAGFQDALFGFGMRYAMLSGHLAAHALMEGSPGTYDRLWHEKFGKLLKLAVVNRIIYERLRDSGYSRLLNLIGEAPDARDWLGKYYGSGLLKQMLYPLARRRISGRPDLITGCMEGCDCTLCRCLKGGGHGQALECSPQDGDYADTELH
jgi:flavin-dependent dehydrogenase